jgi:signal transduction histidine kinase/DNA-binding LacI/PurR family transcriptional regulator/AraC-like DNA-binding protein
VPEHFKKSASQPPKRRKDGKERPVFGFLLASLHTGASRALLPGLVEAAERQDVNLICFPGGRLRTQVAYEAQRNAIYDLAGEESLDGLVTWASSLGGVISTAEINAFHQRYSALPIVSLAQFMEGTPTVSLDSYHGMRALLEHLIKEHGYTRLAFIRGPEGHYYAQERYRAYIDTLQAHDLPLIPELVTRPLRWEAGAEAVNILLDERSLEPGKDFHAVVAVSDMLALWALKTLQQRGFQVPGDVAVTGFNNSIEERLATPPLTTVDLPFYDQGVRSIEVLAARWRGETVPALLTLPSRLVVRQSCGCPSEAVAQAAEILDAEDTAPIHLDQVRRRLAHTRRACLAEMAAECGLGSAKADAWLAPVLDAFLISLSGSGHEFIQTLENVLDQAMRENSEIILWHGAISVIRQRVLPGIPAAEKSSLEALFAQARIVIGEAVQRSHAYWHWQSERLAENLRETARTLLTAFDLQQLTDALTEALPRLGIPSAYLALYDDPAAPFETARLVLACSEAGRINLGPGGRSYPVRQILPPDLLPRRRYSLVVEPLYFQEKSIGFAVFEFGPQESEVYELLRSNLSSALQGASLFEEIQQARITAEKADRIKTRLLANVSHEMRTPLNIILGYTRNALQTANPYPMELPGELLADLRHIQNNAEHQLRVINDLLDLSRAQIDELDLSLELMDPLPVLTESFHNLAGQSPDPQVSWQLELPERLPVIRADPVRLRQIFLNLLSNARKFTEHGQVVLGAEVAPPQVHFWISDTGPGIPADQQERIFEPFVTLENNRSTPEGIGLGLSITRHLIALHGGTLTLDSQPGRGSTFHVFLPLPILADRKVELRADAVPVLLLIASNGQPGPEIRELCQRQGLEVRLLRNLDDLEEAASQVRPKALAWDLTGAQTSDWAIVRRMRHHPGLGQVPFLLFGQGTGLDGLPSGVTGFVLKTGDDQPLLTAIESICPFQAAGPVLIVDDDEQVRQAHRELVESALPACPVRLAENGEQALQIMAGEVPDLVLLDLVMPGLGGADVLDEMRSNVRLRKVPVIILSNKAMGLDDVRRLEKHYNVVFQSKGIWSEEETIAALNRALFGTDGLPAHTSALVKRAIAFLHENHSHPLSRWEVAETAGVSEDYLTRVFNRELGISPWEYLNRYRVLQAKSLLRQTSASIQIIARQVGFNDQAYFSRVFRKLTGLSPQAYRNETS